MKTIRKINIAIACFTMLLFTACKDEIVREPSPVANPNSTNVFFRVSNVTAPVLSKSQTSFKVILGREKSTAAQVVTLLHQTNNDSIFTIPSTVSFAAGQDSVAIDITVNSKMQLMTNYHLSISVDPEQTNPYAIKTVYPRLELNVLKEDFAPYANGTYTSLYFKSNWPQTMEYSPSTKVFRLKDCWVTGYNVTFKWDDTTQASAVTMIGSAATGYIIILTGYLHPTYGMVSAYYSTANTNYYNSSTQTFTFPITWRVAAGSFGLKNDTYVITQKL